MKNKRSVWLQFIDGAGDIGFSLTGTIRGAPSDALAFMLVWYSPSTLKEKGYRGLDLSLISNDHHRTPELAEGMEGGIFKRCRIYRYFMK
ncbi:MAG: hypothetical protein GYA52_05730 [Chloroflexi bacterium]|nr:hypothetical protein [Chloroflexota bacterium]